MSRHVNQVIVDVHDKQRGIINKNSRMLVVHRFIMRFLKIEQNLANGNGKERAQNVEQKAIHL